MISVSKVKVLQENISEYCPFVDLCKIRSFKIKTTLSVLKEEHIYPYYFLL